MRQSDLLVLEIADMLERNGDKNMSYVDAFYKKKRVVNNEDCKHDLNVFRQKYVNL